MKIGIVGCGVVGPSRARLFAKDPGHEVACYDKFIVELPSQGHKDAINPRNVAFVSVLTPKAADGVSGDLSARLLESVPFYNTVVCTAADQRR